MTEKIVAAAIFHGAVVSLPMPARHHTILHEMSLTMDIDTTRIPPENQGFLTDSGRYVGRVDAYYIAYKSGQVGAKDSPALFSEDLW